MDFLAICFLPFRTKGENLATVLPNRKKHSQNISLVRVQYGCQEIKIQTIFPQKLYRKVLFQLKFRFTSQKLQFQQVQTDCFESWISELGIGATVPMVYSQGRGAVAPQISNVDGTKKGGINFSVAEPEPIGAEIF